MLRRTAALLALALLLAGCRDDRPAPPRGDPVGMPHGHVESFAADDAGDLVAVWARGWGQHAERVVAVRTADGTVRETRLARRASTRVIAVLPDGWLIGTRGGLARVGTDAVVHALAAPAGRATPTPGDVAIPVRHGVLLYRDGSLYTAPRLPSHDWITAALVTDGGSLVVAGRSTDDHAWWARLDGGTWTSGTWPAASVGVLSGRGHDITVTLGGGTQGMATRVAGIARSDDDGATWRVAAAPHGVLEALSGTTTSSGTAFVTTGSGQLLRIGPEGEPDVVPRAQPVQVTAAGDDVYVLDAPAQHWNRPFARVSSDGGATWSPAALPGAA